MFSSIILAAGKGQRMKSNTPKVLHKIGEAPLIWYPLTLLKKLNCKEIAVVINEEMEKVNNYLKKEFKQVNIVIQETQLGTANALNSAKLLEKKFKENLLILYGDVPLLKQDTIEKFTKESNNQTKIKVLVFKTKKPKNYGRIILDKEKNLRKIVEEKDTNKLEKKIKLCNSGIIFGNTKIIFELLKLVKNDNKSKEYYLTDIVKVAYEKKIKISYELCDKNETMGINTQKDLAKVEKIFQNQKRLSFLDKGVSLSDPKSNYFSYDTEIGKNTKINQNVVIGKNVIIGENCNILPFTHLEGCVISSNTSIGPL